nr:nucleoside triphosphate pyrophosphatase [Rhodoligotrophos defluvii]
MLSRSQIVLASTSPARRSMLEAAGVRLTVAPPEIDENAVKQAIAPSDPADMAMILAQTKAVTVSEANRSALVVGADQVLAVDGQVLDKPKSKAEARDQLLDLRGRQHVLFSAVACARNGAVIWSHDAEATLSMRAFSTEFLGAYLAALDEKVTETVGGYHLEGLGAQMFDKIEGDYFTVLGLPLLPLLAFLREEGVLLT